MSFIHIAILQRVPSCVHVLCLCPATNLTIKAMTKDAAANPYSLRLTVDYDRCHDLETDAATVNQEGVPYFFKRDHLFKGFHGDAELANETFSELDDHHNLDHVDAALFMHHEDDPDLHNHFFFFLNEKVFSYYQNKVVEGYPKDISEVFPGIPDHLEAAVECPKIDCDEDSVIFFKGHDIYHYHMNTQTVDKKHFESMPNCTSAFHFMENYYCFHGHQFSKFNPKPERCTFGKTREKCSRVHLDALTSDDAGNVYAFRSDDNITVEAIDSAFKEIHSDLDAVFSYDNHLYMIKDDNVHVYKIGEPHIHLDGYPKTLKEELGVEGHVDTAMVCNDHPHIAHIIQGNKMFDVDMKATPREPTNERPLSLFKHVDTAMCGPKGVTVVVGNHFYHFDSVMIMVAARALPEQHRVSSGLFGCDH
uniref:Hemopexin a n=1 Tax=Neogobius melanostomus TaxID=47308 RepID=A0A8C6UXL8_9GOBI